MCKVCIHTLLVVHHRWSGVLLPCRTKISTFLCISACVGLRVCGRGLVVSNPTMASVKIHKKTSAGAKTAGAMWKDKFGN